jgi:hypothetical protein
MFGVTPTAKAAHVLARDTDMATDTVAKLLHEWSRLDRPPLDLYRLPVGSTVIVDEAGMIGTASLDQLVGLADVQGWRLALVGDPRQLQAVGRGGLFNELCATGRVHELARVHRFTQAWEAAASLQLRAGNPKAFDAYQAHDRIVAGPFDDHLRRLAVAWIAQTATGQQVAITTATNAHVNAINHAIQAARIRVGHLDAAMAVDVGNGEHAHPGDVVATRHNDRHLVTDTGHPVRNRDVWTVTATHPTGALTVTHLGGHGNVVLPDDYVRGHVQLGYAATEYGTQADTVDVGIALISTATDHRGLYTGATRGRHDNRLNVVTDTDDVGEARDVLDTVLTLDRADIPAVTQRRQLARQDHAHAAPTPAPVAVRPTQRCEMPDWLHDLYDETRTELHDAEQQATLADARIAELQHSLPDAEASLRAADIAYAPWKRIDDDATKQFEVAQTGTPSGPGTSRQRRVVPQARRPSPPRRRRGRHDRRAGSAPRCPRRSRALREDPMAGRGCGPGGPRSSPEL